MDLAHRTEELEAPTLFCHRCGSTPDIRCGAVLVYPRTRFGAVLYRFPCSGRPACMGFIDLHHQDLQAIAEQASAARVGVYLGAIEKCRAKLEADLDAAPDAKDRIAAARELRKLSERQLEVGRIVAPKVMALPTPEVRVLPGSIVERKLREKAMARLGEAVRAEAIVNEALSVPDPVNDSEVLL